MDYLETDKEICMIKQNDKIKNKIKSLEYEQQSINAKLEVLYQIVE